MKLSGENALVTGTSRGIGPAIASALAAEGARVLCHARNEADARARADELGGVPIFGDLSTEEGLASIAAQAMASAAELHVLAMLEFDVHPDPELVDVERRARPVDPDLLADRTRLLGSELVP